MKEITLTPEQSELVQVYSDKYFKFATCVDPADRLRAEAGVRSAYEVNGLKPPKSISWASSPYAAVRAAGKKVFKKSKDFNYSELQTILRNMSFGLFDAGMLCYWMYVREV